MSFTGVKKFIRIVHAPRLAEVPEEITALMVGVLVEFACRDGVPPVQPGLPFPGTLKARGYRVLGMALFDALLSADPKLYNWFWSNMFKIMDESIVFEADCCQEQELRPP